jgi:hypothetical protein
MGQRPPREYQRQPQFKGRSNSRESESAKAKTSLGKGMNTQTLPSKGQYSFSNKRFPCSACGSSDGFARVAGRTDAGYCHACNTWIPPEENKEELRDDGILHTRFGGTINTRATQRLKEPCQTNSEELQAPIEVVRNSLAYIRRCQSNEDIDERAAILEYEGGLPRHKAEQQAGLYEQETGTLLNNPMKEEITLLRRESPFAAATTLITQRRTILSEWNVGLSNDGAVLFWYVDQSGKYRNAKKIWYDTDGFHRLRDQRHSPHYLYKGYPIPIYGEHQLRQSERRPFALFESEKTAIIASVHMPKYVCLALGGHNLKDERKAGILRGRSGIILFDREPETIRSAHTTADTLRRIGATVTVEDLESIYPGIPRNWDAADIIFHQFEEWQQKQLLQ